jgi:Cdc6-like AAA superfamily ATPase
VVDVDHFPGRHIEKLHDNKVISHISTNLGGLKVSWVNTQGFAYIVKEERVPQLEPIDLVEALAETPCALIHGTRGTGKTTLLQHVIRRRKHKVVVFDIKPIGENDWLHAQVFGRNMNFEEIDQELDNLVELLHNRIKNASYEPLLIIADEWWLVPKTIPNATQRLFKILVSGRTAGMDVFVCGHSLRVKGLDIEGESDLLDGFVKVHLSKVRHQIRATIDFGDGPVKAQHPGPIRKRNQLSTFEAGLIRFAYQHNNGSFSVGSLHSAIKRELPERVWTSGGILTYHQLQSLLSNWEERGLLIRQDHTQKSARVPSKKLKRLAGI